MKLVYIQQSAVSGWLGSCKSINQKAAQMPKVISDGQFETAGLLTKPEQRMTFYIDNL
jgi:hypothetical protein